MDKMLEMQEQRAKLVADARAMEKKAADEKRDLTTEEITAVDKQIEDALELGEQIKALKVVEERASRLDTLEADIESGSGRRSEPIDLKPVKDTRDTRDDMSAKEQRTVAFEKYCRGGRESLNGEEFRALQADSDVTGGYLYPDEQFINELIQTVTDQVFIRQLSRTFPVVGADTLGFPAIDTRMGAATWTSELATGSADSTLTFGKRELTPHPLARKILVSTKLLKKASNAAAIVRDELARVIAEANENAFLTGNGAQQPLGIFVASATGISTSRDISTDMTTTAITTDGLKECKYSLKGQYWRNAAWVFHRDAVKQLAKLKDGDGRYMWEGSIRVGEPDRLLGFPVYMSEFAPNTFTTGLYVGILGDFSKYWIVDDGQIELRRGDELYMETNQVIFIARMNSDAMPVVEEAFARVTLA